MANEVISQTAGDEEILTFEVADDALERAASAEQTAFTLFYCTSQISVLAQQLRQLGDIHRNAPSAHSSALGELSHFSTVDSE